MESGCLVSVIIPVFNVRPYLADALDSVLCQTYKNLEILMIDDGSTDGSGALCDAYAEKDRRIRVIHQENGGVSRARNTGLERMTGEVVAFLDPDDEYHPDFIASMLNVMQREGSEIVLCRYTLHKTTKKLVQTGRRKEPQAKAGRYGRIDALRALADGAINVSIWNKLYLRELWENIRFPEGRVYEDFDIAFSIFDVCRSVTVIDQPLYLYRKRPGSITTFVSWEHINDMLEARSHFDAFIQANTPGIFPEEQTKKILCAHFHESIAIYARYAGIPAGTGGLGGEKLRREIIEEGKELRLEAYDFRARASYRMLCACPRLLRILYSVYRPVREIVRKWTGPLRRGSLCSAIRQEGRKRMKIL